ncbi:MAG: hypothetical protein R3F31_03700 [Verrucomicrobiales bacterium]
MTSGAGITDTGGSDTPNFTQIGNGGHQNQGSQSGQIVVLANALSLTAGTREETYSQIGHGGFEDDTNPDGALGGDIFINFDPTTGTVVGGGGDIILLGEMERIATRRSAMEGRIVIPSWTETS